MSVAVRKLDGVESVDVSLEKATADIRLKPGNTITLPQLRKVIRDGGYPTRDAQIEARGQIVDRGGALSVDLLNGTSLDVAGAVEKRPAGPVDTCIRYGGDEFVVLLPSCTRSDAEAWRRRLQEAVAAIRLRSEGGQHVALRVSAGVSVFPEDGQTYERLLARADRRMYRNKAQSKVLANRLPAPGYDAAVSPFYSAAQ